MPLLYHPVLRLAETCAEVIVVLAPRGPEPPLPAGLRVRLVRDPVEGEGPLVGMAAALGEARTSLALVVAGDMPWLEPEVLREMVRVAAGTPVDAVVLQEGERFRPLPCAIRVARGRAVARTLLASGGRRLRDLLGALLVSTIDETAWTALDPSRRTLLDVDQPGDVESLRGDRDQGAAGHASR